MCRVLAEDYRRHDKSLLNPALWAVWNYRYGVWLAKIGFAPLRWLLSKCYGLNLFLILITSGICLYRETKIGKDLHLIHSGNISIHPGAVIGDRCGIMHDVTIGTNMGEGAPIIGDDVFIGAGAKVLGGIRIGNNVNIAANSLVISDIPDNSTAMGVPAKVWHFPPRKGEGPEAGGPSP